MRRFQLQRPDVPVGVIAQGVQFDDGGCALRWLTGGHSTALYACVEDLVADQAAARLIWLDPPPRARQYKLQPANVTADRARALGRRTEIIARLRRS